MSQEAREPLPASPRADEVRLRRRLDDLATLLVETSHRIHARPETRFEEFYASGLLADLLSDHGFKVQRPLAGLDTAFLGTFDTGRPGPRVAIFCEYDALPEIGHGCGHNVIAAAGLGAALLTKDLLEHDASLGGTLLVVGSPGEEGGGGKIPIIDSGVLDGVDAAMMLHPSGENIAALRTLSRAGLQITFSGRAAHAAERPEQGINALDAAVLTLTAIGLLRQQVTPDVRIHAIVTKGGDAQNIIPERTVLQATVRAEDPQVLLESVVPRVESCARGAALATGAGVQVEPTAPTYLSIQPNPVLAAVVERSYGRLGREIAPSRSQIFPVSTDMGNVSQVVPSIHPTIEIVPGLSMHSRQASNLVGGERGDRAVTDGALMLGMTASALFRHRDVVDRVKATFVPGTCVSRPA